MNVLFYLILVFCFINLFRIAFYLIASDIYSVKLARSKHVKKRWHLPTVSVLVPVHNEQDVVERCLQSVTSSNYPAGKLELIVCNDGSSDNSQAIIQKFKATHKDGCNIKTINRAQQGKAAALNYALKRVAKNQLIMCLDSDSYLEPDSIRNAAQHFRDRQVVALSSNINIIEDSSLLTLLQRFEYIVCYQMKKGQAQFGVEYIVGGIGSMFRRNNLKKVAYYDTNTITEDIDLTLKLLVNKKHHQKIAYAADSVVHTEAAHTIKELMRQRYRWKFGRNQTYLKNKDYIFSKSTQHNKRIAWFMIPFSLFQDLLFLFEPVIIGYFGFVVIYFGDLRTILTALIVLSVYLVFNIWGSQHLSLNERVRLTIIAPLMYFLMYVLSWAEYYALIKSIIHLPKLRASINTKHSTWKSPARRKLA